MSWLKKRAAKIAHKLCYGDSPRQKTACECDYDQHPCGYCVAQKIEAVAREFARRAAGKAYVDAMKYYGLIPASELEELVDEALGEADRDE